MAVLECPKIEVGAQLAIDADQEVEVDGRHVLRLRIKREVGIERITRLEHEQLPGIDACGRLDGVVITVEAMRIIFAMLARFRNDHRGRQLDFARVGPRAPEAAGKKQRNCWQGPNKFGFHSKPSLKGFPDNGPGRNLQ